MEIYHGVVRGSVVVLPEGVNLPDGVEVEVHAMSEEQRSEELFKRELLKSGLLQEIKTKPARATRKKYNPVHVKGKLISEQIIEERR